LASLEKAGVLKDGYMQTARGIQCLANDGHLCLSLGEKEIDDWLSSRNIPHEKEIRYPYDPELNPSELQRCDWKIGDLYVTNTRLIFIGEVRKSKDLRQKFDGLSIFYDDMDELGKIKKDKFSVLCVFKKGRWRSQKARIYFKKVPEDQIEKVTDYIRSALQDIEYAENKSTGSR